MLSYSNETRAPIANPPNSAQIEGTPYYCPKLHPGPCNSVGMRRGTGRQTQRRPCLKLSILSTKYTTQHHIANSFTVYSAGFNFTHRPSWEKLFTILPWMGPALYCWNAWCGKLIIRPKKHKTGNKTANINVQRCFKYSWIFYDWLHSVSVAWHSCLHTLLWNWRINCYHGHIKLMSQAGKST